MPQEVCSEGACLGDQHSASWESSQIRSNFQQNITKVPVAQAGFRPGQNCCNQILALTLFIENGFNHKKSRLQYPLISM